MKSEITLGHAGIVPLLFQLHPANHIMPTRRVHILTKTWQRRSLDKIFSTYDEEHVPTAQSSIIENLVENVVLPGERCEFDRSLKKFNL